MKTPSTAILFFSMLGGVFTATPIRSDETPTDGLEQLTKALAPFELAQPWMPLDDAPKYVRRNRGAAKYLVDLLKSRALGKENRARIARHFLELSKNRHRLSETAEQLDREGGKYYRETLKFDVLRFLVELVSEGKQSFHFPRSQYNEAYYSRAEGRSQLFQVVLPSGASPRDGYPMIVQVHGTTSFLPSEQYPFIRVRPSARGVWGFRSMSRYDITSIIAHMKLAYPIDSDRVYMIGSSAGATGAMHAAAYRQDLFAGLVPLVAFGNDLPLENFRNLPIRCEHGANDWTSSIGNVRAQFQRLTALEYDAVLNEHPTAGHGIRRLPPKTMKWLFGLRRCSTPKQIVHTCEHPSDGQAYWFEIEAFLDPHVIARIDAKVDGNQLTVSTINVRQFSLDGNAKPIERVRTVTVDKDTVTIPNMPGTARLSLVKRKRWEVVGVPSSEPKRKRAYGAGAAANLFQGDPLMIVYGTGGDSTTNSRLLRVANTLARTAGPHFKPGAVRFPLLADTRASTVPLGNYNLLVIGTPENNSYLRMLASHFPYTVKNNTLNAGKRKPLPLKGTVLSFHYFNPDRPNRLIYVVSPYLDESDWELFSKNPRHFLAGSEGFKRIDQPDLLVRGVDLRTHREMQLSANWEFLELEGEAQPIPKQYEDRTYLAMAHMKVMRKTADVDLALWWGPEDKGAFGGYDFNWLPTFAPPHYTRADYAVRRREIECLRAALSGEELREIYDRWIATKELITWPVLQKEEIDLEKRYRIVLPMDLVVKLGNRRKTLSDVQAGPVVFPKDVAKEVFASPD